MFNSNNAMLLWRCRRGVRELDSLLIPYCESQITIMNSEQKSELKILLDQQDPDLLDWFLGRGKPENLALAVMVENVLKFNQQRLNSKDTGIPV